MIGGIVGGVVALLLVGGLIAFLVVRNRRSVKPNSNATASDANSAAAATSNYDRIPNTASNYSGHIADASPRKHYDSLTSNEL
jgi:predicted lipid-binding transport protein (Tim44 family)